MAVVKSFMELTIFNDDNLEVMSKMASASFRLAYADPPYNTGKTQKGRSGSYQDSLGAEFLEFLRPRLQEVYRLLSDDGSLFLHLDWREVHRVKVLLLDEIFGRESFINEIIHTWDYGARSKKKWPAKHSNILWYAKNPADYIFNYDAIDRIPYLAPGLVGPEKAALGKTLTDVWWQTVVPTMSKERTGYPTQKPLPILRRIVRVHSNYGDDVLDFFAGSGTTGEAALIEGRSVTLIDNNPEAVEIMEQRLSQWRLPFQSF